MSAGTTTPITTSGTAGRRAETHRGPRLDQVMPYVLVVPTLIIIGVFRVYPLIRGAGFSFTGDGAADGENVGFANFRELWHDERFIGSLKHVGVLLLLLPLYVALPLLLAALIHVKIPGHRVYRAGQQEANGSGRQ